MIIPIPIYCQMNICGGVYRCRTLSSPLQLDGTLQNHVGGVTEVKTWRPCLLPPVPSLVWDGLLAEALTHKKLINTHTYTHTHTHTHISFSPLPQCRKRYALEQSANRGFFFLSITAGLVSAMLTISPPRLRAGGTPSLSPGPAWLRRDQTVFS